MRIVGYLDRFSFLAGEPVAVRVSTELASCDVEVVRLLSGETASDGSGFIERRVEGIVPGRIDGSVQNLPLGSYGVVEGCAGMELRNGLAVALWVCSSLPGGGVAQSLVSTMSPDRTTGFELGLDEGGAPVLRVATSAGPAGLSTGVPLRAGGWYLVIGRYDHEHGALSLSQQPYPAWPGDPTAVRAETVVPPDVLLPSEHPLLIAARWAVGLRGALEVAGHFNGRIERPALLDARATGGEVEAILAGTGAAAQHPSVVAAWDFTIGIDTDRISDIGPRGFHGRLVNMPTRAMTGHAWKDGELDRTIEPSAHGAIHFHDDDLEDAGWRAACELELPGDLPSGAYAVRLTGERAEVAIPFLVRPTLDAPRSPLLFLLSTNTYLAYGNQDGRAWAAAAADGWPDGFVDPYPLSDERRYAIDQRLRSLYDVHTDGSGVCYASWRRPIVNLRPTFNDEPSPDGRGFPHGFQADLQVVGWLNAKSITADVAADEDLDREGVALLGRYRALLTGTHPEYWTAAMLDAVESYLHIGGRVIYLGGNGFYWVTSYDPARRHVIEVRRSGGSRAWTARPGEYRHSTTGEPGGLWRHRGRPPQRLFGVGFTAQGSGPGRAYVRTEASRDPRAAWIFEGVGVDEPIGSRGLVMGAAGALEFDRADPSLGTPFHALTIATASGFSDAYQHAVEEVAVSDSRQGGSVESRVRADMVYFETPNDGAVFSAGSIGFGGSLPIDGYVNAASRVLENVVRGFLSFDRLPGAARIERGQS